MSQKTGIAILIGLAVIILVLAGVLFWPKDNTPLDNGGSNNPPPSGNEGIQITSPSPNGVISSPVTIKGSVKGNGWTGFEGQVGIVKLFDASNKELAMGILTATSNWMQLPTPFETTLFFDYPSDGTGTLVFYNENASGEPSRDRAFSMPVKLTKSSAEKMKVKAYFNNTALDPAASCTKVFPLEREVPKTQATARVALEQLIKGLSDLEKDAGYVTNINPGVVIQSLVIKDSTATVDFNDTLQQGVAGSCKVTAIRAQITETLKQFPTVKNVVISINGKTQEILQP